jgi:hypothetical protein
MSRQVKMESPIIKDRISKEQYERYNYSCACEDCTHFDATDEKCTFGFPTLPFLRRTQIKDIAETGKAAFCRAIEID